MNPFRWMLLFAVSAIATVVPPAGADSLPEFHLAIENHRFIPVEIKVPAGQKIRLVIDNRDPSPEEFESYDFNREKIVPARGQAVLFVGPLAPGRHEFFGEFNPATARGALIAE